MKRLVGTKLSEITETLQRCNLFKNFNDTNVLRFEEIQNPEQFTVVYVNNGVIVFADDETIKEWGC